MVAGDEEFSFPGAVYYQLCEIVVHLLDRTNFDKSFAGSKNIPLFWIVEVRLL